MRIGVDFDNTVVCYDQVIHSAALERGLIPDNLKISKNSVRDYLRSRNNNDAWTKLQGYVYGPGLDNAVPFPGVKSFLGACRRQGIEVRIISHRTRYPIVGPAYDLHQAAANWFDRFGFLDPQEFGLKWDHIHFEVTKTSKLQRIMQLRCAYFIDDLPEFLAEPEFPAGVVRVLFDPNGNYCEERRFARVNSWHELLHAVNCGR